MMEIFRDVLRSFAVVGIAILAYPLAAQEAEPAAEERIQVEQWQRGYHAFVKLGETMGLTAANHNDLRRWLAAPPREKVLVSLGAFGDLPVDVEEYLEQGGALLIATDRGDDGAPRLFGLDLTKGPAETSNPDAAFHGYPDCPVVTRLDHEHPLTDGVLSVVANRPGWIYVGSRERWRVVAMLPRIRGLALGLPFIVARETPTDGRIVVIADQSVFANQMLLYEDNARFAINVLRWLGDGRTSMLVLDDLHPVAPRAPEQVQVEIPPPTPEEVRDALRQLPPETLVDFGNAVAATVEDEGIPNDLIAYLMQKIADRHYRRLLIAAATLILGVVLFRRFGMHVAAEETVAGAMPSLEELHRGRAWVERQRAAAELLERFRLHVAGASSVPWKVFAARVRIADQPFQTFRLRRALNAASRRLELRDRGYWTRRRLQRLDAQLAHWRRLRESGALQYRTTETAS
jgi:hypothetical protein